MKLSVSEITSPPFKGMWPKSSFWWEWDRTTDWEGWYAVFVLEPEERLILQAKVEHFGFLAFAFESVMQLRRMLQYPSSWVLPAPDQSIDPLSPNRFRHPSCLWGAEGWGYAYVNQWRMSLCLGRTVVLKVKARGWIEFRFGLSGYGRCGFTLSRKMGAGGVKPQKTHNALQLKDAPGWRFLCDSCFSFLAVYQQSSQIQEEGMGRRRTSWETRVSAKDICIFPSAPFCLKYDE